MTQQAVSAAETSTFGHFSNIWDVAHHTSRVLAKNDQNCGLCVSTSGSVAEINAEMLSLRVGGFICQSVSIVKLQFLNEKCLFSWLKQAKTCKN